MKKNIGTYLLFLLLIGAGFLMYRYMNPKIDGVANPDQTASVVDSVDDDVFYSDDGEVLLYPKTQSFSNAESNAQSLAEKTTEAIKNIFTGKKKTSVATNTSTVVSEPKTVFGVFYADVLQKHGTDKCSPRKVTDNDSEEKEVVTDYDEDNFKLQNIVRAGDSAYLFVDSEYVPDDSCGTVISFASKINHVVNNIYILVSEEK